MSSGPTIFSFFAGVGLLDLGFEHNGFDVCYVNEYEKSFMEAYKYAREHMGLPNPRFGFYNGSAEDLLPTSETEAAAYLIEAVNTLKQEGSLVGFLGGPPCPDFSVGGKNKGGEGENGRLTATYIDLIAALQPDFFVFENVKGLFKTKKHRLFYEEMLLKLESAGYILSQRMTNAIEFGVPQDRDRIIVIGIHKKHLPDKMFKTALLWHNIKFPQRKAFTYSWPLRSKFIIDSQIEAPIYNPVELTVEYWFKRNNVLDHPNAVHCFTPRNGMIKFLTIEEGDDSGKSFKRLHRWRYSPTAAYGNNEVHLHPYQARRLNVAEVLAIQSAPINFVLPKNMSLSDMFKTLGNAVPYLMAAGIAKTVGFLLRSIYGKSNGKGYCNCDTIFDNRGGILLRLGAPEVQIGAD